MCVSRLIALRYPLFFSHSSMKTELDQLRLTNCSIAEENHHLKMMYDAKCDELKKVCPSAYTTV